MYNNHGRLPQANYYLLSNIEGTNSVFSTWDSGVLDTILEDTYKISYRK